MAKRSLAPSSAAYRVLDPPETSLLDLLDRLLVDASPILGDFAVLPSVKLPTGSAVDATGTGTTDLGLLLISSRRLGPIAMDLNVGYTRRSGDGALAPNGATVWAASFGGPGWRRLGWAAELFGYPRTTGPAGADTIVAFLIGPMVTLRPWLVVDAAVIAPLTGPQARALLLGVTYNVGRVWRSRP